MSRQVDTPTQNGAQSENSGVWRGGNAVYSTSNGDYIKITATGGGKYSVSFGQSYELLRGFDSMSETEVKEFLGLLAADERARAAENAGANVNANADNVNGDVKIKKNLSEGGGETKKITAGMSDSERAKILRNTKIELAEYKKYQSNQYSLTKDEEDFLKTAIKSKAEPLVKAICTKVGIFKKYSKENIDFVFDYSGGSLSKSMHTQNQIERNFLDFAKMITIFDDVVENAVIVEAHTDKYKGTSREDTNLKLDYVLLGAFRDGYDIIPVEFNLKEYRNTNGQNHKLYFGVTLNRFDARITKKQDHGETLQQRKTPHTDVTNLLSGISIPQIIENVNAKYGAFLKYFPSEMLNDEQIKSKESAIDDDIYRIKVLGDEDVSKILKKKAKEKGYSNDGSYRMDHSAPNSTDGYSNSMDKIDKSYNSDGSIYSPKAAYYYGEGRSYDKKAIAIIQSARNNPRKMITVYRAVPSNVKDTRVRNGDWVAIVKEYATEHGERMFDGDYRIIENTFPAGELFSNGDSINEWGYDNGNANEVYKNTPNNVKLLEPTYDDSGQLIPLSKRYDDSTKDIRYSLSENKTARGEAEGTSERAEKATDAAEKKVGKYTAAEQDAARDAVKNFDMYEADTRRAVLEFIRSTEGRGRYDKKTVSALCGIMVCRPELAVLATDLEKGTSGMHVDLTAQVGRRLVLLDSKGDSVKLTALHEAVHDIEGTEGYSRLKRAALKYTSSERKAEIIDMYAENAGAKKFTEWLGERKFSDEALREYLKQNPKLSEEGLFSEIVAKTVAESLNKADFLDSYSNRSMFSQIISTLKRLGRYLSANEQSKTAQRKTAELIVYFREAMGEGYRSSNGRIRYSQIKKKVSDAVDKIIDNKGVIDDKFGQIKISNFPQEVIDAVKAASDGKIDLSKKFIALNANDLWHEYKNHSDAEREKAFEQIPLTPETLKEAILAIYSPDIIESVFADKNNSTQRQSFVYAKKISKGHYVVVEAVGGKGNPNVVPVMVLQFSEKKFNEMIANDKAFGELFLRTIQKRSQSLIQSSTKRTELPWRNLLLKKPLQILHVLLSSIIVYHLPARMSRKIFREPRKTPKMKTSRLRASRRRKPKENGSEKCGTVQTRLLRQITERKYSRLPMRRYMASYILFCPKKN